MIQAVVFLIILTVVVMIHELGHFLAARKFGIKVEEFGFGFPPRAFRLFRKGETEYTVNWLPIGGFVKIYGENGEGRELKDERAFWAKPTWQRAIVLVAGVVMNFVLGVTLFSIVYSFLGVPAKLEGVKVVVVATNSPAAQVGLKEGMIVRELIIDDEVIEVTETQSFLRLVNESRGKEISLRVRNGGDEVIRVTPRENPPEGEGSLGIVVTDTELRMYPWWQMPFRGMYVGVWEAIGWGREVFVGLVTMVTRLVTGKGLPGDLAGPIGIYQITNQARQAGILVLLQFVGVLSVNLAILNLMPLPALDGGRLVFVFIEMITGKKLREDVEGIINFGGMVFILGLMLLITGNDLLRLVGGFELIRAKFGF